MSSRFAVWKDIIQWVQMAISVALNSLVDQKLQLIG